MKEKRFSDSLIIPKDSIKTGLINLIPNLKRMVLRYRFTRDRKGDRPMSQFHAKCDGIGPTVILIKAHTDKVFGAYTDIEW